MPSPTLNGNGHRRRQLRARVLAEETDCALCGTPVDKPLRNTPGGHSPNCQDPTCPGCTPHPRGPVIDEDIPRIRGGSPYDRNNCHLMHRECNRWKADMTLAEAKAKREGRTVTAPPITASAGW